MAPPTPDGAKVRLFRGSDIGPCDRRVTLTRGPVHERMQVQLTFKPGCVYEVELSHGRGFVPQQVAVYIQEKNPGGNLRVV